MVWWVTQLKFKSKCILGIYVKFECILRYEKSITQLHFIYTLFIVLDFVEHFFLLFLYIIKRCNRRAVQLLFILTSQRYYPSIPIRFRLLSPVKLNGYFLYFQLLGFVVEGENLLIFILLQKTWLILGKRIVLVGLGFNFLTPIALVKVGSHGLFGSASILLLSFFDLLNFRRRSCFWHSEVLFKGHSFIVEAVAFTRFFLGEFVEIGDWQ